MKNGWLSFNDLKPSDNNSELYINNGILMFRHKERLFS